MIVAKKRIYELAKVRGMVTQDLAEQLRAAGVEVNSNLASVEESDVERVLGPVGRRRTSATRKVSAPAATVPVEAAEAAQAPAVEESASVAACDGAL